jgi:hypothetical protein
MKTLGTQTTLARSQDSFAGVNERFLLPYEAHALFSDGGFHEPRTPSRQYYWEKKGKQDAILERELQLANNYSPGEVEDAMALHMLKDAPSSSSNGRISTREVFRRYLKWVNESPLSEVMSRELWSQEAFYRHMKFTTSRVYNVQLFFGYHVSAEWAQVDWVFVYTDVMTWTVSRMASCWMSLQIGLGYPSNELHVDRVIPESVWLPRFPRGWYSRAEIEKLRELVADLTTPAGSNEGEITNGPVEESRNADETVAPMTASETSIHSTTRAQSSQTDPISSTSAVNAETQTIGLLGANSAAVRSTVEQSVVEASLEIMGEVTDVTDEVAQPHLGMASVNEVEVLRAQPEMEMDAVVDAGGAHVDAGSETTVGMTSVLLKRPLGDSVLDADKEVEQSSRQRRKLSSKPSSPLETGPSSSSRRASRDNNLRTSPPSSPHKQKFLAAVTSFSPETVTASSSNVAAGSSCLPQPTSALLSSPTTLPAHYTTSLTAASLISSSPSNNVDGISNSLVVSAVAEHNVVAEAIVDGMQTQAVEASVPVPVHTEVVQVVVKEEPLAGARSGGRRRGNAGRPTALNEDDEVPTLRKSKRLADMSEKAKKALEKVDMDWAQSTQGRKKKSAAGKERGAGKGRHHQ